MRNLKRLILAAVGLGLVALLVVGLLPQPVTVETGRVTRGVLRVSVQGTGKTRVKERFFVLAAAAGHLERVRLEAGDAVTAGQEVAFLVASLPAPLDARTRAEASARLGAAASAEAETRAAADRARLLVSQARNEVERVRTLARSQAVSQQVLEQAEYQLQAREKELELAQRAVERARREVEAARATLMAAGPGVGGGGAGARAGDRLALRSPADGKVLRVLRESEGPIAPGTPVLEIGDPASLEAVVDLLTTQAVRVRPGAPAELEQWGGRGPLPARVSAVEPSGFTKVSALGVEEQRVNVILEPVPDGRAWSSLGDGYQAEARILVYERPDALKVPGGALFRRGEAMAVFLVRDGRAVLREVRTGEANDDETEVLDGLAEGDVVIVHPSDKVEDGRAVRTP